jgi:hypothetical protein
MVKLPLTPYVACKYFESHARRFTLGLHGTKVSHYLRIKFIRDIHFQDGDDGQRLTFDHVSGLFILHGQHLQDCVNGKMEDISDLNVFDPERHQPVGKDASIIHRFEVLDYSPGRPRFELPHHVLYAHED